MRARARTAEPQRANVDIGSLHLQGKITAQGKLLLQDTLNVMEQSPKTKGSGGSKFLERRVFLFEQIIIISEELEKKKNALTQPGYIYKNSLLVSTLTQYFCVVHPPSSLNML